MECDRKLSKGSTASDYEQVSSRTLKYEDGACLQGSTRWGLLSMKAMTDSSIDNKEFAQGKGEALDLSTGLGFSLYLSSMEEYGAISQTPKPPEIRASSSQPHCSFGYAHSKCWGPPLIQKETNNNKNTRLTIGKEKHCTSRGDQERKGQTECCVCCACAWAAVNLRSFQVVRGWMPCRSLFHAANKYPSASFKVIFAFIPRG